MRSKSLAVLGTCLLVTDCTEHGTPESQAEAAHQQELIAGAPMTADARLIERPDGKWRLVCMGRFRGLGMGDSATYDAFVTFFEESAQTAPVRGQVTAASPTLTRSVLGNLLTMTHPSADIGGSLTVRMARGTVDPRRRHACQVVIKQNGVEVMRTETRPPRHVDQPAGTFADSGQALGNHATEALELGDLDGDGDLDAFEGNTNGHGSRVWLNSGSGVFTDTGQALASSRTLELGDLDGDGDLDAMGYRTWLNNGSGTFTDTGQATGNDNALALGDVDADGDIDAVQGKLNQANRVWLNNGSGTFTDTGQVLGNHATLSLALGDLDGDGDLDVMEGNLNQANHVWLNNGSGVFTGSGQNLGNHATLALALGDLDGDGDLDALEGNGLQFSRVWLNNGSSSFTIGQFLLNRYTRTVALGDLDGDGDLDALQGNYNQLTEAVLNNGDGTFTDGPDLGNHATIGLALGDVDGDGDVDSLQGGFGQANRVWRNQ